jgi:hypothetical protein
MIGDIGVADGAQKDRIAGAQQIQRVLRHHSAVREIVFGAPIEVKELAGEIVLLACAIEDPFAFRDDFLADTVAGDHCNIELSHGFRIFKSETLSYHSFSKRIDP